MDEQISHHESAGQYKRKGFVYLANARWEEGKIPRLKRFHLHRELKI